jgi:hypothetical protein
MTMVYHNIILYILTSYLMFMVFISQYTICIKSNASYHPSISHLLPAIQTAAKISMGNKARQFKNSWGVFQERSHLRQRNVPVPHKDVRMALISLRKLSVFQFILFWFRCNVHTFFTGTNRRECCPHILWNTVLTRILRRALISQTFTTWQQMRKQMNAQIIKVYGIHLIMSCMKYLGACMYRQAEMRLPV